MAEPLDTGADQVTVAEPSPATASTDTGASGTTSGATAIDAVDALLVPRALMATTVKA